MPSEAVQLLTEHLAAIKQSSRQAIETMSLENEALKRDNSSLKQKLQAVLDELDFRNGQVAQLQLETSEKWRVEERNDWRSLVDSVQSDRDELREENERLKQEIAELRASSSAHTPYDSLTIDTHTPAPHHHPGSDHPSAPSSPTQTPPESPTRVPYTPTTQLRRELREAKRRLEDERSTLQQERRESQRLRTELEARRQRERWQNSASLIERLVHLTRVWNRSQVKAPVLSV